MENRDQNVGDELSDVRTAAAEYRKKGIGLARLRPGLKTPKEKGWTTRSAEPNEFGPDDSVGIQGGWLSDGGVNGQFLAIVDLDDREALEKADEFLPPTAAIEGHPGKRRSHRYYFVTDVPEWAESSAPASGKAAIAAGKKPGPAMKHFTHTETEKGLFDLIATGGQVVAPPSLREDGNRREWEEGCDISNALVITFHALWAAVIRLAEAIGAEIPKHGPEEPKVAKPRKATAAKSKTDSESDTKAGPVLGAGILLDVPMKERVKRCERYLQDVDPAKSGFRGHRKTFRVARLIVNDFAVTDREKALELMRVYNELLELQGEETWTEAEMAHKIDSAIEAPEKETKPFGCKLQEPTDETPRTWDDPAKLAEGFLKERIVRIVKQTAFEYREGAYQIVSAAWLTAQVRGYVERAAAGVCERTRLARVKRREELKEQLKASSPAEDAPAEERTAFNKKQELIREELDKLANSAPAKKVTGAMVSNTLGAIAVRGQLPDDTELDSWIGRRGPSVLSVENGLLDPVARTLHPHTDDWFSTAKLPLAYDPTATKPEKWLAVLNDLMQSDPDLIAVLQEVFGACLDRGLSLKFFAALVGSGDNGKSVVLSVLGSLLGKGNCSSVNLDELTTNRFAAFSLFGKLANVVGDQGYFKSPCEGRLKTLTGGDLVTFEQKGRDSFAAVNRAKLVFACNEMPSFADKSEAVWNRLVAIPFEHTVPAGKKNPALLTAEYWAAELPGILNWALDGLARLHAAGRFTRSEKCEALKGQTRLDSNPARLFATQECCFTGSESDKIAVDEAYRAYASWCEKSGFDHTLTKPKFGRELRSAFPNLGESKVVRTGDSTTRYWIGVKTSTCVSHCDRTGKSM